MFPPCACRLPRNLLFSTQYHMFRRRDEMKAVVVNDGLNGKIPARLKRWLLCKKTTAAGRAASAAAAADVWLPLPVLLICPHCGQQPAAGPDGCVLPLCERVLSCVCWNDKHCSFTNPSERMNILQRDCLLMLPLLQVCVCGVKILTWLRSPRGPSKTIWSFSAYERLKWQGNGFAWELWRCFSWLVLYNMYILSFP